MKIGIGTGVTLAGGLNPNALTLGSAPFFAPLKSSALLTRGTGSPTFTRATTATVMGYAPGAVSGASQVLLSCASGEARFSGARKATNICLQSNAFTTTWVAIGTPSPTQNAVGITGAANEAWTLTDNDAVAAEYVYQNNTLTAASYTNSIFVKKTVGAQGSYPVIYTFTGTVACVVTVDTSNGVATLWSAYTGLTMLAGRSCTCENYNADFWRVTMTYTATAAVYTYTIVPAGTANSTQSTGIIDVAAQGSAVIQGAQVELGSVATTYIPTTTVAVTKYYETLFDGTPIPEATLKGYLSEPAATNICLQSNAFTTTWLQTGTPSPTQNAVGITGAANEAWTLTDNAAGVAIYQYPMSVANGDYTASVFVKKTVGAQPSYPVIYMVDGSTAKIALLTLDTSNGVATIWSAYTGFTMLAGASARCFSYNYNFWRVELTATYAASTTIYYQIAPAGTTNATQSTGLMDVAAQGSAVIQGAQLELGSFATSYIPTTTVAVTRNADVESYPTASNIVAAQGSIYLEYTPTHTPVGTVALFGTYVDASNYTAILHDATNLIFRKRITAVNYDATIANAFASGTTYKMAATWGAAGSTIALNGTMGTPHVNTTAAQIAATMQLGANGNSLQQPTAQIKNDRVWQTQLSDAVLKAITV